MEADDFPTAEPKMSILSLSYTVFAKFKWKVVYELISSSGKSHDPVFKFKAQLYDANGKRKKKIIIRSNKPK